ncbi:septum formation protein Maf [Collinsella sp. An7]|uniref:Maf family protein n=1 Tax=Collinsella sp. An7 TaxID=1965651 RepID=UPI000B366153|nr:Maf family protein [Collinsella sp. An7]OUN46922.1 septum formation protein Maf [Collinsella sp. An7]
MILASQSPRRIELMREAGFDVRVIPADVDETPRAGEPPFELVERLAATKAEAVAAESAEPGELVLAADTIVAIDGEALGKPADETDARAMLRRLSGRTHQVATGVCLLRAACEGSEPGSPERPATRDVFTVVTDVTFYDLADAEIDAYVATGEPADKAGAYGIQGTGGRLLVRGINGDFYNVVGLPIAEVVRHMRLLN